MAIGKEKLKGALNQQANALEQSTKQVPRAGETTFQMDLSEDSLENEQRLLEQWEKILSEEKHQVEQSIRNIHKTLVQIQEMYKDEPGKFKQWYTVCGYTKKDIIHLFTYGKNSSNISDWLEIKEKVEEKKGFEDLPIYLL